MPDRAVTTLAEYMYWLRQQGGHCKNGISTDEIVGMTPVIKLVAPSGRYVIHSGDNQLETLSPLTVEYFDRRLQLLSPFRSVPRA